MSTPWFRDPLRDPQGREQAALDQRIGNIEARPHVTAPATIEAVPAGGGTVTSDWYRPMSDASYARAWEAILVRYTNLAFWARVAWNTEAGTSGLLRLAIVDSGLAVVIASGAVTLGVASSGVAEFRWLHSQDVWRSADNQRLHVQTYRTAGANFVNIGYPQLAFVDPAGATLTGV
jgi:hypothetical protein